MLKELRLATLAVAMGFAALLAGMPNVYAKDVQEHRLVLQVDTDDAQVMSLALGNAINAKKYYESKNQKVTIEIVAYGPGISMFRTDASPVKDRIEQAKTSIPDISLSMCGNAKATFEKREGHEITPLPGVKVVPAGIVRIMELEEQGYSYVRP